MIWFLPASPYKKALTDNYYISHLHVCNSRRLVPVASNTPIWNLTRPKRSIEYEKCQSPQIFFNFIYKKGRLNLSKTQNEQEWNGERPFRQGKESAYSCLRANQTVQMRRTVIVSRTRTTTMLKTVRQTSRKTGENSISGPGGGALHLIGIDQGAAQVLCRRARQPLLYDLPQLHLLPLRGGQRLRLECQPGLPDGRDGGNEAIDNGVSSWGNDQAIAAGTDLILSPPTP